MANRAGKFVLHASIVLMVMLAVLCVFGAFAGAARAKIFFNSPQMIVFWCFLLLVLLAAFVFSRRLWRRKMLLLVHAGIILVLAGGMYGSEFAHVHLGLRSLSPRAASAMMKLHEGEISNVAVQENGQSLRLPFYVHLKKASIEFYDQSEMPKDYFSDLEIIVHNEIVKKAVIEVNKPLYYGGYHFYQNTFAMDGSVPVSGILMVSAQGIGLVFSGYLLAAIGLFGQFWFFIRSTRSARGAAA